MPTLNIPGDSVLNALGGFLVVLGIILVLGGLGLAKLEKFTAVQGKKTWVAGVILTVLGGAFLLLEVIDLNGAPATTEDSSGVPLQAVHIYNFESIQDVTFVEPWEPRPDTALPNIVVSNVQEFSHSGTSSLRVAVDLAPYTVDTDAWAGIRNSEEFDNVQVITSWVLLPQSEQLRNNECNGYMAANVYTDSGETVLIYSHSKILKPGVWTPFFLGAFSFELFSAPSDTIVKVNSKINLISLKIWCAKSYTGSVYFDDIIVYTDSDQ